MPADLVEAILEGAVEDLLVRNKIMQNEQGLEAMWLRWVKQRIHEELDLVRNAMARLHRAETAAPAGLTSGAARVQEAEEPMTPMKHVKGPLAPAQRDGSVVAAEKAGTCTGRAGRVQDVCGAATTHCGTLAPTPSTHEPGAARCQGAGEAMGQEAGTPEAAIGQEEATNNVLQEFVIPTRYVVHSHHSGGAILIVPASWLGHLSVGLAKRERQDCCDNSCSSCCHPRRST